MHVFFNKTRKTILLHSLPKLKFNENYILMVINKFGSMESIINFVSSNYIHPYK